MVESQTPQLKSACGLTQAAFDHLLSCLGPDRESASRAYLELRRALFTYFAVQGATDSDQLADETFDRVARRLSEGQTIFTESPANYFYGVARNVWRESLAKAGTLTQLEEETIPQISSTTRQDLLLASVETEIPEKCLACLEKCLREFSAADREMLMEYYSHSGGAKIEGRKMLALRLDVSLDSLRHRVARLKLKLASCIRRCARQDFSAQ